MLLNGKVAVIYGAGGSIGGAVARAFAREGARLFLTGRTLAKVEAVSAAIRAVGGAAEAAEVDALDERAIEAHLDEVIARAGRLDISFNLITHGDVQGIPLLDMTLADFKRPVVTAVRTTFLTARGAARRMIGQGAGTILAFGGDGDPLPGYHLGGLQVAFSAIEAMRRSFAGELGEHGIRFVSLRTDGVPESIDGDPTVREQIERETAARSLLGRAATLDDVGNVAAFAASDWARTLTATAINITGGAAID
jgi:NAD(P)-dependent dehydrogenase (short-subunit alcohol dehydrogenase family)